MDAKGTGKIIMEGRKKQGLTQKELSEKLFVSDKAISKWERGLCFPDITLLIPLTEILKVSLYELLKGESEEMNTNDYENVLKKTIDYSSKSVKKTKRKYLIISAALIILIIISSVIIIAAVRPDDPIGAITDRDTVYGIERFTQNVTDVTREDGVKIENILSDLPLKWYERALVIGTKELDIRYGVTFDEVIKAYNDEHYVKLALLDIPAVLFTTVKGVDTVNVRFADIRFTARRKAFEKIFGTEDMSALADKSAWEQNVGKKLENDRFVEDNFKTVERYKEPLETPTPKAEK